jgi:cbb3-type cytochrome oxidase subunit 3
MRLSDVVSGAGLAGYAEIALIIFLVAFVAIVLWIFSPRRRRSLEAKKHLPFEEDQPRTTHREGDQS